MSTAAVTVPATAPVVAATHVSFLTKLGHLGMVVLSKVLPFLVKEAVLAEPLVSLLFPLEGPLYVSVVTAVSTAQIAGTAAAGGVTTGEQKFEAVFNAVSPGLLAEANKDGLVGDAAEAAAKRYIQAIFDIYDGPAKNTVAAVTAPVVVASKAQ